ncbi:MAG: peptidoglycan DD-metalloendopeptidase family protein [Meiothermus sp.]|nr:peptidoglycan DD-metalloendopeptidase family protein [Meiothermus sp.]
MGIKPGWILLGLLVLLSFYQCSQITNLRSQVTDLRNAQEEAAQRPSTQAAATSPAPEPERPTPRTQPAQPPRPAGQTLTFRSPLPGACAPRSDTNLPGATRTYRRGVNPGVVFTSDDACIPVRFGTAVLAAAGGEVIRAETGFQELSAAQFRALLRAVVGGANPEQMNRLRGREVWVRHTGGAVTIYAHLSSIAPGIRVGSKVEAGQWIGRVGNSGLEDGVNGTRDNARLLFELWNGQPDRGQFFGSGTTPAQTRARVSQRFGLVAP